jgi:uncharacterized protein YdhG (YjbR/CyaY superfamily)
MDSKVETYINALSEDRRIVIESLREAILSNIPPGYEECFSYNMIGYVVPHSIYTAGYHCTPSLPLPFINISSMKGHIAVYHMGLYSSPELMEWFQSEWIKATSLKLDMGSSCIRFKKMEDIPYELIGKLASKITVEQWISIYEKKWKTKEKKNS